MKIKGASGEEYRDKVRTTQLQVPQAWRLFWDLMPETFWVVVEMDVMQVMQAR